MASSGSTTHHQNQQEWYADGLRFTCRQCGNCCTGPSGYVWFTRQEANAIADYLNITRDQFFKQYARKVGRHWSLAERAESHGYDCVFLQWDDKGRGWCSIYPVRPTQCRTWPFWPENLASPEDYLRAAQICEGMQKGLEGDGKLIPVEQIRILRDSTSE